MTQSMRERISALYQGSKGLALRDFGVAMRLGEDRYAVREELHKLMGEGILYRFCGYYALNPSHLWKTNRV